MVGFGLSKLYGDMKRLNLKNTRATIVKTVKDTTVKVTKASESEVRENLHVAAVPAPFHRGSKSNNVPHIPLLPPQLSLQLLLPNPRAAIPSQITVKGCSRK